MSRRQLCGGIPAAVQKMLQFGRQLHSMGEQLKREFGTNNANKKALLVGVSLLLRQFLKDGLNYTLGSGVEYMGGG